MTLRLTIIVLLLLLCSACPRHDTGDAGVGDGGIIASKIPKYPIPFPERPYTKLHPSAAQAWFLTETAYFVVADKYKHAASSAQRSAITTEIDHNIFGVNDKVDQLFKDAIKAEPKNPLNYAAYAIYLKPRKRFKGKGFTEAYPEALQQIDKAIALWPDESSFYVTKIFIMTAPHMADQWLRSGAGEDIAIESKMPEIDTLFTNAEKYDPNNSFINYWHAILKFRYTDPDKVDSIREDVLREIEAGNHKSENYFTFGAPVPPRQITMTQLPILYGGETEAKYVDQWGQFGTYPGQTIENLVSALAAKFKWPQDKDKFAALMYFYYNLGRTKPYNRSYFSMQLPLLVTIRSQAGKDGKDAAKLADLARYLDDQYRSVGNKLYDVKLLKDPAKVNAAGINELEESGSGQENLRDYLQGPEAAYLHKAGEVLGLKFPLPEDPTQW